MCLSFVYLSSYCTFPSSTGLFRFVTFLWTCLTSLKIGYILSYVTLCPVSSTLCFTALPDLFCARTEDFTIALYAGWAFYAARYEQNSLSEKLIISVIFKHYIILHYILLLSLSVFFPRKINLQPRDTRGECTPNI